MLKPRALRAGDRVAVVAPATPFAREAFDAGVAELTSLGFEPVFDDRVFARRGYVSGAPEVRAGAIHDAWRDASIAALIAVRGGYGSVQILPLLDRQLARRARKAFIGYSDLTSLLVWLNCVCGMVAFHGPMLADSLGRGEAAYDRESLHGVLTTTSSGVGEMRPPELKAIKPGEAAGVLLGGNLAQLVASLATPYAFDPPEGFVLFLDEVGERPYRIDRMFTQLRLSGLVARAAAIVFGELPRCDDPGGPTALGVVEDLVRDFGGPVLAGFSSGHTIGPGWTLPLGVRARVAGGARPALVIEEAAVE